jgi:hypothetical protein
VLQFAVGGDLLILQVVQQAVAGDGLEVADRADDGDFTPGLVLLAVGVEQFLVGEVGQVASLFQSIT